MTTLGRGPGAGENYQSFQGLDLRLLNTDDMYDPPSASIISHVRQTQALGLALLLACSPAPLSVVMCNLSTFHIHLTFVLTRHRLKDRFVCAGRLWYLADTHNVTIEQRWGPCSTSPISHLLAALHHNLETPSIRQERYTNRNCWPICFMYVWKGLNYEIYTKWKKAWWIW